MQKKKTDSTQTLRQRAEEKLKANTAATPRALSLDEEKLLLHELQVHQIELEMQNEELRRMQGELEISWSQYFDLYDLAPVGYLTISEQGLILKANLTATSLLGVERATLVKQQLTRFILPEDQDIYYLHRNQLLKTGVRQSMEMRFLCAADRPVFWVFLQITPAQDGDCRVTLSDITDRKLAEETQKRLQEQLAQIGKMESVGRLAGGVAHDFNNMLSVILGNAELALNSVDLTQPLQNNLMEIRKAAQRSANLTRQLLAFACKETITPKVFDLNGAVEDMLKMLRRLIGEDIEVDWLPGENLWPIKADPSQIDQVLLNLCVNARDAIDGVGKLTIETGNVVFDETYCVDHVGILPGEYVLLGISDNGSGMDKEILEHIFEPFYTTKEFGQGTGMGMATVYGIVQQSYGFINVDSELGKGTTAKIYLPRQAAEQAVGIEAIEVESPKARGETVLVVEDELPVLKLIKMMLAMQGYVTLVANTTDEAIRLATEHVDKIHLLVTDVVMPDMNGRDLAARIQSIQPTIKVILMSGYTADIIAQNGVLDERFHFIQKPFSINEMANKVREVLDSK